MKRMHLRKLVWLLVLMPLILAAPASGLEQELRVPDLGELELPEDLAARVDRLLPSRPGDTFLQLRNGMTLLVRENHASPVVSCRILVKTGAVYEDGYLLSGISHYLEHVVAGGSTRSFTENEAREMVKSMGGASNAYTGYDRTVYFINTTAAHYKEALRLLFSYVSESLLAPEEVAREKAVIQQEYKLREDDGGRQLWQLFMHTAYLKHPVRHPVSGYEDVFVELSREDLLAYYRQRYAPQNMVAAVVGDLQTPEVVAAVLELSENMARTFHPPVPLEEEPSQSAPRRAQKSFPPARLTTMMVGFPTVSLNHPDLYPLDVLAVILGEGRTSRLYRELKDKRQLVLSAESFSWTPSFVRGVLGFSFSLERDKVNSTLTALEEEINRLQRQLVGRQELAKAKQQIISASIFSKQSSAQMAATLASSYANTGDPYFDSRYLDGVKAVSLEDIRRVARSYLKTDRTTVAILTPPSSSTQAEVASTGAEPPQEIKKLTLENGLTLLLKRNAAVPIVAIKLFGLGGQRLEPEGLPGLSSFTAALLTKGTRKRSKQQIAAAIERVGGELDSGAGRNTYHLSLSLLKDDWRLGLELLADILMNPSFPRDEIKKQKQDTIMAIRRLDEDWDREVQRLFRRHYYEDHPYGRDVIGTEKAIREISRADIQDFYERTVVPGTAVLAVFGDIDSSRLVSEIRELLGKWRPGKPPLPENLRVAPLGSDVRIQKKTDKVSAAIFVGTNGLKLTHPDRPVLDVIDAVLSGISYPSGRLYDALRGGDRSLVYVIHAFPFYGLDGGHFGVLTQTSLSNHNRVLGIILDKLERLRRQPLDTGELEAAKNMCITMHEMGLETNGAQAASAALNEALGLGFDWDSRYPELIRQVGEEDVSRVAGELFGHTLVVSTIPENPQ